MTAKTVHVLRHGLPLCGFATGFPADWPPGHSWVGMDDLAVANCAGCREAAGDREPVPRAAREGRGP
jgi:hypothetical protein